MIVGQFGWDLGSTLFNYFPREELHPGDVIIQNDPYLCAGAIQHTPDLLVARPLFHEDQLVGIGSIFGNLADIGTAVPGSMPTTATSIFEEGIRFPPVKLYDAGKLNKAVLDILARNTRLPDMNVADVMALSSSVRLAETRIAELCDRFGRETYVACTDALLERTRRAMKRLIEENIPEEPTSFEDLDRRRRPRKRAVQDEAHLLPQGREGGVRLDRHVAPGARADQPDAVGGHVQDRHRRVPHHGVRPRHPVQSGLLRPHRGRPAPEVARAAGVPRAAQQPQPHAGAEVRRDQRGASDRAPRSSRPPPRSAAAPTSCSAGPMDSDASSTWSRSSMGAFPVDRWTTASTATPGGRSSRTSRASTWSPTIRCGSRSTTAPSIPAAPAVTAAATASRSGTGFSRRERSRCTTIVTGRSPGGSAAASQAPSPARP